MCWNLTAGEQGSRGGEPRGPHRLWTKNPPQNVINTKTTQTPHPAEHAETPDSKTTPGTPQNAPDSQTPHNAHATEDNPPTTAPAAAPTH